MVIDEDIWLGTDPLLADSDRYHWDGYSIRRLFPSFGDGIPDGWEVHFGLEPLNRTNALLDPDNDGWDANRDGGVSPDVSRTRTALALGESLSTLEEYFVHNDNGNSVLPGMKTALLGTQDNSVEYMPLSFDAPADVISLIHYDVRYLDTDDLHAYAATKYGLTVFDYEQMVSYDHWMPEGIELHSSLLLSQEDSLFALAVATSAGPAVAPLQAD